MGFFFQIPFTNILLSSCIGFAKGSKYEEQQMFHYALALGIDTEHYLLVRLENVN